MVYEEQENSMKFLPIKILLKGGAEHEITEVEYQLLCREFPRVAVAVELAKMAAWCRANPQKRKTPVGVARFVSLWLSRAKEQTPRQVTYAAAHKPFQDEEKTPEEVKEYAKRELARMQAMIDKRAKG